MKAPKASGPAMYKHPPSVCVCVWCGVCVCVCVSCVVCVCVRVCVHVCAYDSFRCSFSPYKIFILVVQGSVIAISQTE